MRKLIAAFKTSVDGKIEGPEGFADWVDAWSDDYGLTSQIDACLLGAHMYPGYEQYWIAIQQNEPGEPLPMTSKAPIPAEVEWGRFAAKTPHYVLSNTLKSANWPKTSFLRSIDDVAALKQKSGKDIYLMGALKLHRALSMPGWWMNLGSLFTRLWPVKGRHCSRRRNSAAGSNCARFSRGQMGW